jgi:peptidoglycan pentaglycine glycine transferase (the first glycine)
MVSTITSGPYELQIGAHGRDDAWDAFVDTAPGGHHVQTTRWAEVKAVVGWQATRVVARLDGEIAGGCQVLMRRVGPFGAVAYAAKAPLARGEDPAVVGVVLAGIDRLARAERIVYVKLQPPLLSAEDAVAGARPALIRSDLAAAPTCTVRVRTDRPPEDIFRGFHRGVRSNIRKAERRGVQIRDGGDDDLATFVGLVGETATRQRFPPYPASYYHAIWRAFAPDHRARLLLAEQGGTALAGILVIGFGDSVVYKMGGWSGVQAGIHPNELLHWTAITWAHRNDYRYYDFDGIDESVARALANGEEPPGDVRHGVSRFKLRFGGDVAVFPGAYDYAYWPWLRGTLRHAAPHLRRGVRLAQLLLGRRHAEGGR